MNIQLWTLGKENTKLVDAGIEEYTKRINRYLPFQIISIDNGKISKSLPKIQLLEKEASLVVEKLLDRDLLIVLDEKGKSFTSLEFAEKMNHFMNLSPQRIIFLIGGSYGIDETLKKKAVLLLGLSKFTFPHQLVRLLFTEQLYRAFSILKNEKYHHE
ncbi:MAG: 23S rRNA (pseudouridine(1915)-N(3))-methyltransferase RlmH [Bacteroidetes bacterium]|nr:23S rRNA (pseudouridine(1915)-N(3))-methyltransferase RlmH [Bacteroidota bacterium]